MRSWDRPARETRTSLWRAFAQHLGCALQAPRAGGRRRPDHRGARSGDRSYPVVACLVRMADRLSSSRGSRLRSAGVPAQSCGGCSPDELDQPIRRLSSHRRRRSSRVCLPSPLFPLLPVVTAAPVTEGFMPLYTTAATEIPPAPPPPAPPFPPGAPFPPGQPGTTPFSTEPEISLPVLSGGAFATRSCICRRRWPL